MTFGLQTDETTSQAILNTAAEAGVTFLDCADVYPLGGDLATAGRTEEILGRWLQGQRHKYIVATKAVGKMGESAWDQGSSRKHILDAMDASLRRLGTDYVDLYQLHSDDPTTPLDETIDALDTIVQSGKARYVGVSNFLAYRLARALGRADLRGKTRFVSVQPRYSLLFREIERELLPLASEEGLGVIPYNPLAGGLLTGKYQPGQAPEAGTRFTLGTAGARYQERYWHAPEFAKVEELRKVVTAAGYSLTTAAIAWVLANPAVTAPIIGASRPDQLTDTLAAAELKLDPAIKQKLDDLTQEFRRGDAVR
jgi:aryl-alcohol dehydrogenase (NADP+)